MGWLSNFFRKAARKSYFPPSAVDSPPQPEGHWSIIVDENGDRVTNRPLAATDFLARRPVDYIDGGTEPVFKKDPRLNEIQNLQNRVDYEIRSRNNREHLQKAVFLLSQTDDGRRLLNKAKDMGFSLVFDRESCMEANAVGLCDYANKRIPLAEGRSAAEVALTLKHELQHMEDINNGMVYGLSDTPRSAILRNRVLEGNARVSESVAAAEALLGSPHGPQRQFRTAALMNILWNKIPEMAKEADNALEHAAEGKWTQFAAKVLPAYWRETRTLAYYDKNYYEYINKYVPDVKNSMQAAEAAAKAGDYRKRAEHQERVDWARYNAEKVFTQDRWNAETISPLLTIRGLPYMQDIAQKGFSLASDAAIALTAKAPALFEKLKDNIRTVLPDSNKPAWLDLPVMKKDTPSSPTANPYAAYRTNLEPEAFAPLRFPDRIDGEMSRNDGIRSNERMTRLFNDTFKNNEDRRTGNTDIDRVNYALGDYLHQQQGYSNVRGLVNNALEAGLLAPMGAFPKEYLVDLYGRMPFNSRKNGNIDISPQEAKLIDHWQQMKDKGMDPMWIDEKNKKASVVAGGMDNDPHVRWLLVALKDNKPTPRQDVKHSISAAR